MENKHKHESNEEMDWFSRFMFGERRRGRTYSRRENSNPSSQSQIEKFLNNVNLEKVMETVDMAVATSKQLKPLVSEITPFIKRFSKKNKSDK